MDCKLDIDIIVEGYAYRCAHTHTHAQKTMNARCSVSSGKNNWLWLGLDFIPPPTWYIWIIQDLFVLVDVTSIEKVMWADGDCRPACICTSFAYCISIALQLSSSSLHSHSALFSLHCFFVLSFLVFLTSWRGSEMIPLMSSRLSCVKWKNMCLCVQPHVSALIFSKAGSCFTTNSKFTLKVTAVKVIESSIDRKVPIDTQSTVQNIHTH